MILETPCYLIDENKLLKNLEKIKYLKENFEVKSVLALKCFSTWSVFNLIRQYLDGTTSSSLYETRLGYEKFGGEVHAYSVAFSVEEINELKNYSNKIIFNSISQLNTFYNEVKHLDLGLRINPQISYSDYELADPARRYSRLGVTDYNAILEVLNKINGVMFHYNCENADFDSYSSMLDTISNTYADLLYQLDWISLGGGVSFTLADYPLDQFGQKLKKLSDSFNLQVYLEPGEATITDSTYLVTKILDIVHNEIDIAIVDSSIEAHMLDLLVYRAEAEIEETDGHNLNKGQYRYIIAGKSCLAGDIFGTFNFKSALNVGDIIHIADAGGYTMVKKNWFNGLKMPSIVIKRLDGSYEVVRTFNYDDFKNNLS
jgi:carboxynorspermidine decarboxylase